MANKGIVYALKNAIAKTKTSRNVILLKIQILCRVIEVEKSQKLIFKLGLQNLNPIRIHI
jgi:hypothetical protein